VLPILISLESLAIDVLSVVTLQSPLSPYCNRDYWYKKMNSQGK
jgi:hypothetical protein